ncbi:hypothetical protein ElyMa_002103200 [Elysia marginata]|uniref:Uncharacterized protein n=1 Tax=Elysia marginata TaxID=1093978 RepID=A0AAV4FF10_9GAST|nr:hypothetical protein ElyMa_002103200 [Elysia marginata]
MEQSSNMLRHNSGSIISSLQNYGDSDEEESDSKNESVIEPFSTQSDETVAQSKLSTSPITSDPTDSGITFTATTTAAADPSPGPRSDGPDTHSKPVVEAQQDEKASPEISPAELISDDEGDHSHNHTNSKSGKSDLKDAVAEAVKDVAHTDSPSSQGSTTKPGRQAARLVSYGPDEDLDEDESSSEEEEVEESPSNSPEAPADNCE